LGKQTLLKSGKPESFPLLVIWQAIKEWVPDDDPDLNWFN